MFEDHHIEEIEWAGQKLRLETGKVARQADGAVMLQYGETVILAVAVIEKSVKPDMDFFPLTINYTEKAYSAGRIPGGYFKREGRPTERETLICRLIDRPIRPLFEDNFFNETQVTVTVLSYDKKSDPDVLSMIASSCALAISGAPFQGPVGAARVGLVNGEFVLNPDIEQMKDSQLDLVVAGTQDAVLMVESEAQELSEEDMLKAVMFGHEQFQVVIGAIQALAKKVNKPVLKTEKVEYTEQLNKLRQEVGDEIAKAYKEPKKIDRRQQLDLIRENTLTRWTDDSGELLLSEKTIGGLLKKIEKEIVRAEVINSGSRIDGRSLTDVRNIETDVFILPSAHGSALFTRGETQAIVAVTLGTSEDEQYVDSLDGTFKRHFMLHYNFPPYSVGEVGRAFSTSRREIGHGKLAWRAINPLLPIKDDFPYTLRVVSEITESNGSSSMATVCGASLALMDASVPLKRPVSGIAMGLIKEGDSYVVLSDILGDEDHLGDMDFKVAGTQEGITSLQMDIKISGITEQIMSKALEQAKAGRLHILQEMNKTIDAPKKDVNKNIPRIETIKIPVDKIRDIIGTGGKIIRQLTEETETKIDIEDDGTVRVAAIDGESLNKAIKRIKILTTEPEEGEVYEGKVVKVMDFGAFVNFYGAKDGLVHVSQISEQRVENISDVLSEGDIVKVRYLGLDNRGKIRLSMKGLT